jgi:hypothetical protein
MTFNVKVDSKGVSKALKRFPVAYAREMIPALQEIADGIIANIRRRQIWPNETKGILKQGLWKGDVRPSRTSPEIDMGWSGVGAAFGPGHEWGFKKSSWMVKPVGIRQSMMDSGRRIGQPIKALRFVVGGRVCFSRGHMVSKPRSEKPHFAPAYDAYPVQERLGEAIDLAAKRVGLSEGELSKISVGSIGRRSGQ